MRRYFYWFFGGIFALLSILPLVLPKSTILEEMRAGGVQTTGTIVAKDFKEERLGGIVPGLKNVQTNTYSVSYTYKNAKGETVRSSLAVSQQHYDSVRNGSTAGVAYLTTANMSWIPAFRDMGHSGETGLGYHFFMWLIAGAFFFRAYIWTLKVRDAAAMAHTVPAQPVPPVVKSAAPAQPKSPQVSRASKTAAPRTFGRLARN